MYHLLFRVYIVPALYYDLSAYHTQEKRVEHFTTAECGTMVGTEIREKKPWNLVTLDVDVSMRRKILRRVI